MFILYVYFICIFLISSSNSFTINHSLFKPSRIGQTSPLLSKYPLHAPKSPTFSTRLYSTVPSTPSPPPTPQPKMMDDRLFAVNKKLIDTVYDIICVLYKDKDYPRFFVLETVARVPYFAYLSVLHLKETFGERSDNYAEKMR